MHTLLCKSVEVMVTAAVFAMTLALGSNWFDVATLAGVVLVGAFSALIDRRARNNHTASGKQLEKIYVEVNSRLTDALKRIKELENQFKDETGHRPE